MRAIDAVLGQPWAIEPEWLRMIAAVAERQFDAPAVAAMRGNPPRQEAVMQTTDGVAVINILGPIFPRANMMTENSGATSLSQVQGQFRAALADPSINSILFNIDSPGGVAVGIADFAAEVRAGRKVKPITAYVGGTGSSAAYWIASAASRLVVSATATVGSIGVVVGASKQVAPDANGEISIEIVSSNAPNKRPDVMDSAGRQSIVAVLDQLEAVFLGAVAANRGVSVDAVKSDFGKGGVLMGAQAIAAGMADAIGTIDSVLTKLAAAGLVKGATHRAAAAAFSENTSMNNVTTIAELTAAFPDLVGEIRREATAAASSTLNETAIAAARAEGAKAEHDRVAGIEAAALPGHEKLLAELKADPSVTPGAAAMRFINAEKAAHAGRADAIKGVEEATGHVQSPAATAVPPKKATPNTVEGWKAEYAEDEKLQAEFSSADAYVNFQQGLKAGRIRILGRVAA